MQKPRLTVGAAFVFKSEIFCRRGFVICRMLTIFAIMEQYIVSARKYRPTTFSSVVGQRALTGTLKNAIATDRLAHAYLFCGSRGIGKTSCARIFAKTINCANPTADGEACNECESCRSFNEGRSMNIVELDAASNNGIDDIREVIEMVQMPPTHGRYRVFIIDEVHMLSSAAFNAFLKTLEEPPSYVIFILATTEKHKIIPTILSRCQIYDFNRITVNDIADHLASVAASEGISAERAALNVIARKADGASARRPVDFRSGGGLVEGQYHLCVDNRQPQHPRPQLLRPPARRLRQRRCACGSADI